MAFEGLSEKLQSALKKMTGRGRLTEQAVKEGMREVRMALLEADVNYAVAKDFIRKVTDRCVGSDVLSSLTPSQQVIKIVSEEMTELMGSTNAKLTWSSSVPTIFMLCGLQGAGKTTMCAKLAGYLTKQGKRPMLAACDIYRPAAIKQLQVVGQQVNVPVFEKGTQDPVKTAKEAIEYARYYQRDVLIIDTAGRLHIDEELMDELLRIRDTVKPSEILLTVDAMTGQDAVNVAKAFDEKLNVTGVILTKLDIEPFHPDRMASRILGMGDVLTLIDKAAEAFDQQDAEKFARKGMSSKLTLEDFLDQMQSMKKMGGLRSMINMLPGMSGKDIDVDDNAMKKPEAIIRSMTPRERKDPSILNASRRKRIAAGSGTTVQDVNTLIRQFEQAQQMMKRMMGAKGKKALRNMRFPGF